MSRQFFSALFQVGSLSLEAVCSSDALGHHRIKSGKGDGIKPVVCKNVCLVMRMCIKGPTSLSPVPQTFSTDELNYSPLKLDLSHCCGVYGVVSLFNSLARCLNLMED